MFDSGGSTTQLSHRWVRPELWEGLTRGELLGGGAGGEVWAVDLGAGAPPLVVKRARAGAEAQLAAEALALFWAGGYGAPELLGVGMVAGEPALLLARVDGQALLDVGRSAEELARSVLAEVGTTLWELAQIGVTHGDVKPEHLRIGPQGRVTLLDFGLATGGDGELRGGTPAYLDPSALEAGPRAARERDAFALALTVAEILDPALRARGDPGRGGEARLPAPFDAWLLPFLTLPAGRRPDLSWLLRQVSAHLPPELERARDEFRLRAAYLGVREDRVRRAAKSDAPSEVRVSGRCGAWLSAWVEILRWGARFGLGVSGAEPGSAETLGDLSGHERRRLLSRALGPHAAQLELDASTDEHLCAQVLELTSGATFGCVPWSRLRTATKPSAGRPAIQDAVSCALMLQEAPVDEAVLAAVEGLPSLPVELGLATARVLRRRGELYRAIRLLERLPGEVEARLLTADLERRRGDWSAAEAVLGALSGLALSDEQAGRLRALHARRAVDLGDASLALELLPEVSSEASSAEVRALAFLALGQLERAEAEVDRGVLLARGDEERARLDNMRGLVFHQAGRAALAADAFASAVDRARQSGALLEEGVYATGLASAASDAGELGRAMVAAERAELVFEAIGQAAGGARAVLGQVSVLSFVGDQVGLEERAARGFSLARQSGDQRCEAYLWLCLADSGPVAGRGAAADQALSLLAAGAPADRLRAAARALCAGRPVPIDGDALAAEVRELEPRIEWWGARAQMLPSRGAAALAIESDLVLSQLTALSSEVPGPMVLGSALAAGQELALSIGQVNVARALGSRLQGVATRAVAGAGPDFSALVLELGWVKGVLNVSAGEFDPAQLADVEGLLRTFSQRSGLRDVLRHSLDLLLLWTGVERGLILLVAPEGRLSVRAARNLRRQDLNADQLELSRSMAQRALRDGRPVVAVDAQRDMGSLQKSAALLQLRSVLAVPLAAHGRRVGVAYLDDRLRTGAFGPRELSFAQLIGTLTAMAVSEERDRVELRRALRRARRAEAKLQAELTSTQTELDLAARQLSEARRTVHLRGDYSEIIGRSPAMTRVLLQVDRVAQSDVVVLITGESGTGKELIARAIVKTGARKDRPLLAENCSAVPEALLESTLFGHRRGSFTGANRDQAGLFELSDGGTLFLDEVGEMSLSMQAKLLRVLEDGEVRAIGASRSRKVDVRVIAATHRDLPELVKRGAFREDLYYRLSVVPLSLPPLRERTEDIDVLLDHFLRLHDPTQERKVSRAVRERMLSYAWPGNVRQLENEVRRMLLLGGFELTLSDLSPSLREAAAGPVPQSLREKLDALERNLVLEALEQHRGNRTRAAEALGVSRFGLQKMMARLAIEPRVR